MRDYQVALMHIFPGVRWNEWPELPYELVMGCVDFIDGMRGDGEG